MSKPLSCLEISKANLLHNISEFRKIIPLGTNLVAVVKANAYGHGTREVVPILENQVDYFQVDDIEELREVRKISQKPVLVFGYVEKDELEEAVSLGGIFGVYDADRIDILNKIGEKRNAKIKIHLKIDALLGRQGILIDEIEPTIKSIKDCEFLELESIYSHFSNIEDTESLEHAHKQYDVLIQAKKLAQINGFPNITHHISATSGILSDTKNNWDSSLLRVGMGMYGLWPSVQLRERLSEEINLKPVMKWITKVAQVKDLPENYPVGYGLTFITEKLTKIALIPQGYADGFDRKFSNKGCVLIGGMRAKVLGRVAMNMFVVDISDISNVQVEDEVVLLGKQGNEEITAEELAEPIGRINYEIIARMSPLLPRIVV